MVLQAKCRHEAMRMVGDMNEWRMIHDPKDSVWIYLHLPSKPTIHVGRYIMHGSFGCGMMMNKKKKNSKIEPSILPFSLPGLLSECSSVCLLAWGNSQSTCHHRGTPCHSTSSRGDTGRHHTSPNAGGLCLGHQLCACAGDGGSADRDVAKEHHSGLGP